MKNVLVLFNPISGKKKAVLYKKTIHKFLMNRCKKFKFISLENFENFDMEEYDTILVMGGDGTVRKAAEKVVNTDKTIGIIPTGTANLLAANLGMTKAIEKNLQIISKGSVKKIDMMMVNNKPSILRCGFGYDANIICKTPQKLKNRIGYLAYIYSGIKFALKLMPKKYEILLNNKKITEQATCIIVANAANMYKNKTSISENSRIDDNKMDVFILKTINPFIFFYEFIRILFGIRKNSSRAMYLQTSKMKIKNTYTLCHIDGEKVKIKNDIKIELLPKSVKVFSK